MPQLELATFFSQYFWLVIIFLGFYLVVTKHYLPQIARTKKLRDKRLTLSLSEPSMETDTEYADQLQHKLGSVTTGYWEGNKGEASEGFYKKKERYASKWSTWYAQILRSHKKALHLILPLVTKPQSFSRYSKAYFFTYAISPYLGGR